MNMNAVFITLPTGHDRGRNGVDINKFYYFFLCNFNDKFRLKHVLKMIWNIIEKNKLSDS